MKDMRERQGHSVGYGRNGTVHSRNSKSGVMENGVVREMEEGSPQGGSLSPLLGNSYLKEFDRELAPRSVHCIRCADGIVLLAKSRKASQRLLSDEKATGGRRTS